MEAEILDKVEEYSRDACVNITITPKKIKVTIYNPGLVFEEVFVGNYNKIEDALTGIVDFFESENI